MRIANVSRAHKAIFAHNDMDALKAAIENVPEGIERVAEELVTIRRRQPGHRRLRRDRAGEGGSLR